MLRSCGVAFANLPLADGPELAEALRELDLLTVVPAVRPEDLAAAVTLREALRRAMTAAALALPLAARDVETINSYAADEPPTVALTTAGGVSRTATGPVRCALAAVARDGIDAIARRAKDLRQCEGCSALFLDDSRGGRRRWCSMSRCGNRAKVAGYRSRQR